MITLTPRAAAQVRQLRSGLPNAGERLRISVESGGCSGMQYGMTFDEPKEGDGIFESEGVPIVIDPASQKHLKDVRIDFDDGLHGKGFEIQNPHAHSTCG